MEKYPRPILMKTNAWTVILGWALVLVAGLLFVAEAIGLVALEAPTIVLKLFIAAVVLHVILAIILKCPNCKKCPTVELFGEIHAKANRRWGLDGWAVVIVDVAFRSKFRCIHCGSEFCV